MYVTQNMLSRLALQKYSHKREIHLEKSDTECLMNSRAETGSVFNAILRSSA